MKIPLRFQITEFDCGTLALQNAISYLFERETIPAEVVRAISEYTLDCYDKNGNIGQGGTSKVAIEMMSNWFTEFSKVHDFNIEAVHLLGDKVNICDIEKCINNNGCVLLRTYQDVEHYVLITGIDNDSIYIWDSYYLEEDYYDNDDEIRIIFDRPFDYNRVVGKKRLLDDSKKDFALGPIDNRECVLFNRRR